MLIEIVLYNTIDALFTILSRLFVYRRSPSFCPKLHLIPGILAIQNDITLKIMKVVC